MAFSFATAVRTSIVVSVSVSRRVNNTQNDINGPFSFFLTFIVYPN